MDEPIFTLMRPRYVGIVVSKNGRWTAVVSRDGLEIFDKEGKTLTYEEKSLWKDHFNVIISGDELGYVNEAGHYCILSLPNLEIVEVYKFGDDSQTPPRGRYLPVAFNAQWVIVCLHPEPGIAIQRDNKNVHFSPQLLDQSHFLSDDIIFYPGTWHVNQLYDVRKQEPAKSLPPGTTSVTSDLNYCLICSDDGSYELYDLRENIHVRQFPPDAVARLCPDDKHVLLQFDTTRHVVQDLETGTVVADYIINISQPSFKHISILANNVTRVDEPTLGYLSTEAFTQVGHDGWLCQHDLFTGEKIHQFKYLPGMPIHMVVSGAYLAMLSVRIVAVFDLRTAQIIWEKPSDFGDRSRFYAQLPRVNIQGTWVTVRTPDTVEIWDFLDDRLVATCPGLPHDVHLMPPYVIYEVHASHKQSMLVKFDVEQQSIVATHTIQDTIALHATGGKHMVVGFPYNRTCSIFDADTLQEIHQLAAETDFLSDKIDVKGDVLVIAYEHNTLISIDNGQELYTFPQGWSAVNATTNSDYTLLVTTGTSTGSQILFYRPHESDRQVYLIETHQLIAYMVFADDKTLVTSHIDGTVNFWDITHITKGMV